MYHIIVTYIEKIFHETGRKYLHTIHSSFNDCVNFLEKHHDDPSYSFAYFDGGHITIIETDDEILTKSSIIKQNIKYSSYCDFSVKNCLCC